MKMRVLMCPECKGKVELMHSEYTCKKCGLVVEQPMFSGSRMVV